MDSIDLPLLPRLPDPSVESGIKERLDGVEDDPPQQVGVQGRQRVAPEGIAWCPELEAHLRHSNFIPVTVLARTELLQDGLSCGLSG